jgi:Arc/MetJ family transcription regulator
MRTNIELDERLVREAQRMSGTHTKKAVVELALETLVRTLREREALDMFGKLDWEGDLGVSREGRTAG